MLRFPKLNVANAARIHCTTRGIATSVFENNTSASEVSLVIPTGARDEPSPGVAHVLEKFAFQDTKSRSGLRLQREAELLGGQFKAQLTRENLVLTARFLREDLPYFVDALANTVSSPLYRDYQFNEEVVPLAQMEAEAARKDAKYVALEAAYETAFRGGLGNPLLVSKTSPVALKDVVEFGNQSFGVNNLSLFARNVTKADLDEFAAKSFGSSPAGSASAPKRAASKFFAGESRIKHSGPSAVVLAFPAAPSADLTVLPYVLTGHNVKWSPSFGVLNGSLESGVEVKAATQTFSDASLLTITFSGSCSKQLTAAVRSAAEQLKKLASGVDAEVAKKAIASAHFADAESAGTLPAYLRSLNASAAADISKVTRESLAAAAKQLFTGSSKKVLSVVGRPHNLPYLDELF